MKILVVEDDLIAQKMLGLLLEQQGHKVIVANDGTEALHHYQQDPASVVISDWHMPEMDGIELCEMLRTIQKSYTYFILVSATRMGLEEYATATAQGIDDFLVKPISPQEIAIRLLVAERIIKFTTEIKQLQTLLPICSYCKKSATTATTGTRSRLTSHRPLDPRSPTAFARRATTPTFAPRLPLRKKAGVKPLWTVIGDPDTSLVQVLITNGTQNLSLKPL